MEASITDHVMGFVRANGWILIGAPILQIPVQKILFDYVLMPDTMPQPWHVHAAYALREYVLQYIEYPAIQAADSVFRSTGFVAGEVTLFVAGSLTLGVLLYFGRLFLRRITAMSTR